MKAKIINQLFYNHESLIILKADNGKLYWTDDESICDNRAEAVEIIYTGTDDINTSESLEYFDFDVVDGNEIIIEVEEE